MKFFQDGVDCRPEVAVPYPEHLDLEAEDLEAQNCPGEEREGDHNQRGLWIAKELDGTLSAKCHTGCRDTIGERDPVEAGCGDACQQHRGAERQGSVGVLMQ